MGGSARRLLWLPICLVALAVGGCRTLPPRHLLAADDPRPARLLQSLHERAANRLTLRASLKLALDAPDLRFRRPQNLAVARPARLRVEILGLFGQPAAVLVTDGERYQLYNAGDPGLEEGPVDADLLWRVARVDLPPRDAVDLVLGAPRPRRGLGLGRGYTDVRGGISFEAVDIEGRTWQRFYFDPLGRLERAETLGEEGELVWRADFSDYRMLPGLAGSPEPFAFALDLEFPRVGATASLSFRSVDLVSGVPAELFVLKLPERASLGAGGESAR